MVGSAGASDETWVPDPRFELRELRRPAFPELRRGGLDPVPVIAHVERLERLLDQFLSFTRELEARIAHAEAEVTDARKAQVAAVDEAMLAAFEAKDRILVAAEERAWEIEEAARRQAAAMLAATDTPPSAADAALAARIDALEREVATWRETAVRLEVELDEAAAAPPPPAAPPQEEDPAVIVARARAEADDIVAAARTERAALDDAAARLLALTKARAAAIVADARAEAMRLTEDPGAPHTESL